MSLQGTTLDCLIIGAGPAGLTAAVYLGRYRRSVQLIEHGGSRAALIPISHNLPGFPDGLSGSILLERLKKQAQRYGASVLSDEAVSLERDHASGLFYCATYGRAAGQPIIAKTVLLATGAMDKHPDCLVGNPLQLLHQGLLRHCPICDGYEVIGQRIAVLGSSMHAAQECLFLRNYSSDLTLFSMGPPEEGTADCYGQLTEAGAVVCADEVKVIHAHEGQMLVESVDGRVRSFDTVYSAMGQRVNSQLAEQLGAETENGYLKVDAYQQCSVSGLYAAGDVVERLSQIAVAMGQASVAATAIHRRLL